MKKICLIGLLLLSVSQSSKAQIVISPTPQSAVLTPILSGTTGDIVYFSATNTLNKLSDVATGQVLISGGVSTAPAYSANPTVTTVSASTPGITNTSTDGLILINPTVATVSVNKQYSPRLRLHSNTWDTSNTISNNDDWIIESQPTTGAQPGGLLVFKWKNDYIGGNYANKLTLSSLSGGSISIGLNGASYGDNANLGSVAALSWTGSTIIRAPLDGMIRITNANEDAGGIISGLTANTITIKNSAGNAAGALVAGAITGTSYLVSNLAISSTAPTIASGGCTSPAVTNNNGTASFLITLGSSCTGISTFTLTLPAATNRWACTAIDLTTPATYQPAETAAASTTSVVITNFNRTTGIAADYVAGSTVRVSCIAG